MLEALEKIGAKALLFSDADYPAVLREIPDPPMVVFAWGGDRHRPSAISHQRCDAVDGDPGKNEAEPGLVGSTSDGRWPMADGLLAAIVGTRHPTQYGIDVTRGAATACAGSGIVVVSGMARGCDAIAHSAALDAGGITIGVLGNGFGVIYPSANRALYERVRAEGLLLSEFAPGERPHAGSFPRRNRIISGLARATLVVEAGPTSGALITAGTALDQGREVLAVPGPITSATSVGTN
ncbi:MAG: DNA-processing protein DprA, partial [Gemmatimonadota bacterium]